MAKENKKKKLKKLNIKTVQSPFDEDFQKIDLDFDESDELEAYAFYDSGCRDSDTCNDGLGRPYSRDE